MKENKNTIFLTTTLPYISGNCHVGMALEFIQGDFINRHLNKNGYDSVYSTGLDEHGLKIFNISKERGISPLDYCNEQSDIWKSFLSKISVDTDIFYRTTSKSHYDGVSKLWNICFEKGDIYKKSYDGKYCVGCESFLTDKDLVNGKCSIHHNSDLNIISEENYFFKLSKYKEQIKKHTLSGDFIISSGKESELLNLIENIEDISISRLKSSVPWGVEVPNDKSQVIYVWFSALCNYILSAGYGTDNFIWDNSIQICGPDNLKFQAVIWQGILASLSIPLTKKLIVHGTILDDKGHKMSKSEGNIVDPISEIEKYGLTAFRYYILCGIDTFSNSNWASEKLVQLYEKHLCNTFGNLVNRVNTLIKNKEVVVSDDLVDQNFISFIEGEKLEIDYYFGKYQISNGINKLNLSFSKLNEYINLETPWKREDPTICLNNIHYALKQLVGYYEPILPNVYENIKDVVFNIKSEILFPRLK